MSNASDIAANRIILLNFEGFREDVYDDQTGRTLVLAGEPTIGYGCRCRQWSEDFARAVLSLQLAGFEAPLLVMPWYIGCNDARRSALLEIAFNQGDGGLVQGYPKLTTAVAAGNWVTAASECRVKDPRLQARYAVLSNILRTGVSV